MIPILTELSSKYPNVKLIELYTDKDVNCLLKKFVCLEKKGSCV